MRSAPFPHFPAITSLAISVLDFLGVSPGSRGTAAVGRHKGVEAFRFELRYLSVSVCLFGIRPGLHLVKISDFLYEHLEASRFESRRLSVGICFL